MVKTKDAFGCRHCTAKFSSKQARSRHEKIHKDVSQTTYRCSQCDYSTSRKDALKHNQKKCKALRGKPICPVCGKEFSRNTHLKNHVKNTMNSHTFASSVNGPSNGRTI